MIIFFCNPSKRIWNTVSWHQFSCGISFVSTDEIGHVLDVLWRNSWFDCICLLLGLDGALIGTLGFYTLVDVGEDDDLDLFFLSWENCSEYLCSSCDIKPGEFLVLGKKFHEEN